MKLLIIFVLYKKKLSEIPFFMDADCIEHDIDVYVHDNSPAAQSVPYGKNVNYFHCGENKGVSHAYNRGFEIAFTKNKDCVLLLDQDTTFKVKDLIEYKSAYRKYSNAFIYAPCICDFKQRKQYSPALMKNFVGYVRSFRKISSAQPYNLDGYSAINSGLMIPMSIVKKIGGYNENIKLDFSDVYFIEKYKEVNNHLILLPVVLVHSLSGDEGYDKARELHRFKFYCVGARELADSLNQRTLFTVIRRAARLIIKYHSLNPITTLAKYYFSDGIL